MPNLSHPRVRPQSLCPPYPPYHRGPYLEEHFFSKWEFGGHRSSRKYIDVFWTNIYSNAMQGMPYTDIQSILDRELDPDSAYFSVCQFDDGPLEQLPANTRIFSAGCNRKHGTIVPIPLVCAPIPDGAIRRKQKTLLASFVGSMTHPLRDELVRLYGGNREYRFDCREWTPSIPDRSFRQFLEVTAASRFTLCPRGYGPSSFRLYEAVQLDSVPVYISDYHVLPWAEELDWNEFCVIISAEKISELDHILGLIDDRRYEGMLRRAKEVYEPYFSLNGVFANILKRLPDLEPELHGA